MLPTSLDRSTVDGQLAAARAELEARLRAGRADTADDLKDSFPDVWADPEAALELVYAEFVFRTANGECPDPADWYRRYPHWHDRLERLFALYDLMRGRETHGFRADGTVGDEDDTGDLPPPGRHPPGYEILGEIGRGGMAVVYKARQVALNRVVALKVLRGGWLGDDDRGRIRREAMAAARLQHPHVAQIHEVGEWAGAPFLTLEYVPGGTLADVLARSQRQGAVGVTPLRAAELVETLARAMHVAHEAGIVHRDLKPANILLTGDPADPLAGPKIADFGLAVTVDRSAVESHTATLAGTPCYMAPEQADCRRAAVGPRTDVYALGGLLYELLVGRPPVQGATVLETLDLVRTADPVAPRLLIPNTPRDLETISLKCLRKSPDQRYPSAAALADDLRRYLDGRPIQARPVSAAERGAMWAKRHPPVAGLAAAVVLLVGTVLAVTTSKWRASEAARGREAGLRGELEATRSQELIASARAHWNNNDVDEARRLLALVPEPFRDANWRTLDTVSRAEVSSVPIPNTAYGAGIRLSDSGRLAVVNGFRAGTVLDVATGAEVGKLSSASALGNHFFFSADERKVLAHPTQNNLGLANRMPPRLGQLTPEKAGRFELFELDLPTGAVRRQPVVLSKTVVASSRRGLIATQPAPTAVVVSDVWTGQAVATFDLSAYGPCLWARFDPAGRHLAFVHPTRVVVRAADTWEVVREYPFTNPDRASGYHIHPDLDLLYVRVTFPADEAPRGDEVRGRILGWDLPHNREVFRTVDDPSMNLAVSPDGGVLVTSEQRVLHLYHARTGARLATLRGHQRGQPNFDFVPDRRLVSISTDYQLKTWDLSAWSE